MERTHFMHMAETQPGARRDEDAAVDAMGMGTDARRFEPGACQINVPAGTTAAGTSQASHTQADLG